MTLREAEHICLAPADACSGLRSTRPSAKQAAKSRFSQGRTVGTGWRKALRPNGRWGGLDLMDVRERTEAVPSSK
jgi:hypothetical protein